MSDQQQKVENLLSKVLTELKLDLTHPSLKDTPKRIAKMFCEEIFSSLCEKIPALTKFPNENCTEMILFDNIPFTSTCEHHFVFFSGRAFFLYIPNDWLVGASKVARLIDYFCKKPQIQERLSSEIINHFCREIQPKGAMLVMRGVHECMSHRGVKTGDGAGMTTSAIYGDFAKPEVRAEATNLIQISILDRR